MADKPLYQDEKLRIDYHPNTVVDHILYIKEEMGREANYVIPRGILEELAKTKRGGIEGKIVNFNADILHAIEVEGIGIDGLHVALCQAYEEQERRYITDTKDRLI